MVIIDCAGQSSAAKIRGGAMLPIRAWLTNALVEQWCHELGYAWRTRVFDPVVTLLSCVHKQMVPGRSARHVEDWLDGLCGRRGGGDGTDFCRARARIPEAVFERAFAHIGAEANKRVNRWRSWRVVLVDATTVRVPRTRANLEAFGQSDSSGGKSILPISRVFLAICAFSGAVLMQRIGPYVRGELRMLYELLHQLAPGSLLIGDGAYNSYLYFSRVRAEGGHALAPLDPTRRSTCLRRFSQNDELHVWRRPPVAVSAFSAELALTPGQQTVRVIRHVLQRRGYRAYKLRLCTTLLDPQKYPATELIDLYLRRWGLEVHLRSLKKELGLARLSGKTPQIIRKEILSGLLAFNLVRVAAAQSSNLDRISFERVRELLVEYSARMSSAITSQLPSMQREMLRLIAQAKTILQTRLPEPRAILQHRSCYPKLRTTRAAWRRKHACA
jgi:putative transposase